MDRVLDVRRPPEQSLTGLSRVSKIFFGCDIFQVVAVVVFQGSMIALGDFSAYNNTEHPGMGPGRRIYMAIYMGAVVYTCFLCLFAVKKQNFMEILAFDLQNFAFFTYSCIQLYHVGFKKYKGLRTSENKILPKIVMANAATLLLLNVVFTYLSYKLYMEFGWKIYKRVRFNIRLRAIYQFYELLSCLLKMEILYWGMFALCHSLVLLRDSHSFLYKLNMAFIPMSFVYAGLGYFATRRENRLLMILFLSWTIGGIGYFLYKLYGFITRTCNGCSEFELTGKDIPEEAFMHFVYLGTINLVVAFTIFVVALKAFRNFGGGLAQHFNHKLPPTKMPTAHNLNLGRMSLYPEESVMSVTSYDSMFDEQLGESVRLDRGMMMQASVPVVTAPLLANKGLQHLQPEKRFSSLPDLRVESPPRPTSFPGPSEEDLNILSGWLRVHDNKLEQNSTVKFEIISEETLSRGGLQRDIPNDSTDKGNVMQEEIPSHCKAKTQHSDSSKSPVSRSLSSKMSNTCAGVRCNSYLNGSYEKCCGESPLTQNGENSPLLRKALLMNAKSKQEETCNDCKGKGNRRVHSVDTCECGQNVSAQCGLVQDASGSNGKLSLHTSHFFQEDKTMRDFATGHLEACDRQSVV